MRTNFDGDERRAMLVGFSERAMAAIIASHPQELRTRATPEGVALAAVAYAKGLIAALDAEVSA